MALSEPIDQAPGFPPAFKGEAASDGADPFRSAVDHARKGTDAGLIIHRIRPDHLSAALVLAPETALRDAMVMVLVAAVGFADGLGALAPPEVAVQFDWPGGFRINGAGCGGLRAAASTDDPDTEPDWLVIGLDVPFFAKSSTEPGKTPNRTTLWDEGCSEILPARLLESWARHTLVWIHHWQQDGVRRLHSDWTARAASLGEEHEIVLAGNTYSGQFMGLDEVGSMLLKSANKTLLLPLTMMLEEV